MLANLQIDFNLYLCSLYIAQVSEVETYFLVNHKGNLCYIMKKNKSTVYCTFLPNIGIQVAFSY